MKKYINKLVPFLLLLAGCGSGISSSEIEFMKAMYEPAPVLEEKKEEVVKKSERRRTFVARGMKVEDFAVWFSEEFGRGLIFEESYIGRSIHAEVREATAVEICNAVSRFLGTEFVDIGNTYFIGTTKLDDMGVLIRKVRGVRTVDLQGILTSMQGKEGSGSFKAYVTSDGVIFAFDTERALLPLAKALDSLEKIRTDAWVVQLHLVEVNNSELWEAGVDASSAGNLAYKLLASSKGQFPTFPSTLATEFDAEATFAAVLKASREETFFKVVSQPLFIMTDGTPLLYSNKDSIPYRKRVATETGFIEDTDVEFIESGLKLKLLLRELNKGALLALELENSKVLSLDKDGLPLRNIVQVQSETPLAATGVYLIAQADYLETSERGFDLGKSKSGVKRSLQVFARVFRLRPDFDGIDRGGKRNVTTQEEPLSALPLEGKTEKDTKETEPTWRQQ